MAIKKVGVVGAGLMGHGIAQVAAQAGYDVTLREVNQERLDHNPWIGALVEALAPSQVDHAPAWRAKLAAKLGDRLL